MTIALSSRARQYFQPTTVAEGVSLLAAVNDSKVLAGGQSLVPRHGLSAGSSRRPHRHQPGQGISARDPLVESGRCTGYKKIVTAVKAAVKKMPLV
jgi:xanthine dehydrogenase iron-sulfur cluster and FAD-binding subunit A